MASIRIISVMELAAEYTHSLGAWDEANALRRAGGRPCARPRRVPASSFRRGVAAGHAGASSYQDSTHISDDVVTAGVTHGMFGLEASGFHGAEPGENRWIVSQGAFDSYSARFTVTPNANWTGQFSAGRLTHPEALEAGDQVRSTASVTYNKPYARGNWASSVIWGRVHKTGDGANLNGYGVESVAKFAE